MEIVNNCSYGVSTQRQISETGRVSELVEDAVTETNVDVQENSAYNLTANDASIDCENGREYEVAVHGFTNIPIERNHAYNVHNTGQSDEISDESGQYELVIRTESPANVIVQHNSAYNIITTQPVTDGIYEEIPENTTEQFYEEIPVQQNHLTQAPEEETTQAREEVTTQAPEEVTKVTTPVPPLKAICSFWQGKVEVAVRITILVVRT